MAPRLSKRQEREAQELAALAPRAAQVEDDEKDEDDIVPAAAAPTPSAFGLLAGDGDEDDDGEDEPEDNEPVEATPKASTSGKKKKKKRKKPSREDGLDSAGPSTPQVAAAGKRKAVTPSIGDDDMDEIDKALAELRVKGKLKDEDPEAASPSARPASAAIPPEWAAIKDLFSFEQKYLDPENELRKMFGSKIVASAPAPQRLGVHARIANNKHHSSLIKRSASVLATPEAGWLPLGSNGLSARRLEYQPDGVEGLEDWWTIEHARKYKESQYMFMEVLQQADGNRLFDVLNSNPYHIDTLLQLSEMMTQQGDLEQASTALAKALYALSSVLPPSLPSGILRLSYSSIENRALFLAVARKVAILVRRGTWRTAMEWSKIALGLGGDQDPTGMLMWIDFLAPKADQNTWFLSFMDTAPDVYPTMRLHEYPGLAYARALCSRSLGDEEKSTDLLKQAIRRFPQVVNLIGTTLGESLHCGHKRAQTTGSFVSNPSALLSLLSEIYANRSAVLWKPPPTLAWLRQTVKEVGSNIDDYEGDRLWAHAFQDKDWKGDPKKFSAPQGLIRGAFMADLPSIRPYLPPGVLGRTMYSYDPVPPRGPSATQYDDAYFRNLNDLTPAERRARERAANTQAQGQQGMMERIAQLMQFARDNPDQVPEEVMDAFLEMNGLPPGAAVDLAQIQQARGARGAMPGGFGAEDDDEDDEDD